MKQKSYLKIKWLYAVPVILFLIAAGLYLILHAHAFSADINGDGTVDILDLSIMAANFNRTGASFAQGDLNGDGKVSILDLSILASQWHTGSTTGFQPPPTIASDCSADVTAVLNTWIASVPNNATINFKTNGCYRIEGTLTLTNRNNLVLNGNGATFRAYTNAEPADITTWTKAQWTATRSRSQWSTLGGTNLTFENMIIWGADTAGGVSDAASVCAVYPAPCLEAQMAFNIGGTRGVTIENNQAHNVYGDFVYFGPNGATFSGNATVTGNKFWANGRQGISVTAGDHIAITGNDISQIRMSTFDIEPNTAAGGGFNITIDHNTIGTGRLTFLSNGGQGSNVHDVTISNNVLTGHALGIIVKSPTGLRRTNFNIIGNTSNVAFGTSAGGIFDFTGVDGIQVLNNVQPMQVGRNMPGVALTNSTGLVITGNTFANGVASEITDSTSKVTTNCGNRLAATGAFNFPALCP